MTECNQSSFGFEGSGRREIVARFDGGTISSDGGAFLLRQVDKRLNLLTRFAECFLEKGEKGGSPLFLQAQEISGTDASRLSPF